MASFTSRDWSNLTDEERIELCINAGNYAAAYARAASPEVREIYRDLSEQWYRLADEFEARPPVRTRMMSDEAG